MDLVFKGIIFILVAIVLIIGIYCTVISLYYLLIGLRGYGKAKRDYEIIEDKTRFLLLVASHNEEQVIASTVENLREIDYDKNLFDIVVVNDNSTDGTESECKRVNATYLNTAEQLYPREGVGKPGGLQYALRYLGFEKIKEKYDMVMVLDADNHVSPNMLKEMNSQFIAKGRPEVIQSYLDSKNYDKILSLGYASAYIMGNRFFQLAKYRMGLSNAIGGTGFAVNSEYLISSGGFNYKSLTEDLEMSIEVVNLGGRVLWNHFARVYDEKPDDFKVSIRQRTRWMQGHWFVAFTNFKPLVKNFMKHKKWKYIDQLLYLFSAGKSVQLIMMAFTFVFSLFALVVLRDMSDFDLLIKMLKAVFGMSVFSGIIFVYQNLIAPYYAYKMDSRIKFNIFKYILAVYYYSFTFLYCHMKGLMNWKKQGVWVKTEHKVKHTK